MALTTIHARQILDSRGNPTVEAEVLLTDGIGIASSPSGASTGSHEALELRDGGKAFGGKGVSKAVANATNLSSKLKGAESLEDVDALLIKLGGKNKEKLGANATTAVSMAAAKAFASSKQIPLYEYLADIAGTEPSLPIPMMNVINGGMHAGNKLAVQEFMLVPLGAKTFSSALQMCSEVYHELKEQLVKKYGTQAKNVGDEGGFAPQISTTREGLNALESAVVKCGYAEEIGFAIDAAATNFYDKKSKRYSIDGKSLDSAKLLDLWLDLADEYPLVSIEDPFEENDFTSFAKLTSQIKDTMIVGDDLFVTNKARVEQGIKKKSGNAMLLKVNQVGTVSEAIDAARVCFNSNWNVVVSHRSGETCDYFIADLAVGLGSFIKAGAPARGERVAKYNRLLRIEEMSKLSYAKLG